MDVKALHVLVVEDETFQRNIMVRMLKNMGVKHIYEATDGNAALDVIKKQNHSLDILICDLMMEGMDGMELLRHLGESNINLAIIIASGLKHTLINSIEIMAQAYGLNILGLIEKPITINKLCALFEKYILIQKTIQPVKDKSVMQEFTEKELETGLKQDEFELFFQPKIEMATGQLKGAEALARWIHPEKGVITPYEFIKQMENNGLINNLTWVMLKKSAAYCADWCAAGLNITVSVNLSIKSLAEPGLADRIIELVRLQNLDPHYMILEVTESAITTQMGSVLENLARLRIQGFGLSIDDYGTGYSSLQQLMRIPFSELKIDQSFVTNAGSHESTKVIVSSSLEMARKLMLSSVAEGIESEADWDLFASLGCDFAQGYFISEPIPAEQFYDWAIKWEKQSM